MQPSNNFFCCLQFFAFNGKWIEGNIFHFFNLSFLNLEITSVKPPPVKIYTQSYKICKNLVLYCVCTLCYIYERSSGGDSILLVTLFSLSPPRNPQKLDYFWNDNFRLKFINALLPFLPTQPHHNVSNLLPVPLAVNTANITPDEVLSQHRKGENGRSSSGQIGFWACLQVITYYRMLWATSFLQVFLRSTIGNVVSKLSNFIGFFT